MQTILITGCSSGFGLETARTFLDRGWNVIAHLAPRRARILLPAFGAFAGARPGCHRPGKHPPRGGERGSHRRVGQ